MNSHSAIGAAHERLLTPAQMAAADANAVQHDVSVWHLMQQAGQAVAEQIRQRWSPRPTLVLCGPGNNGGDGFVTARCLRVAGWPVRVMLWGEHASLRGAAAEHAAAWHGPIEPWDASALHDATLVVDAVFGAGLSRDVPREVSALLQAAQARGAGVCAIDVPSGLDGDSGQARGVVTPAQLTVTFFRRKPGHLLFPGRDLCGDVVLVDIDIPAVAAEAALPPVWRNLPAVWHGQLPQPVATGHKYHRGHVLVLGGLRLTGAARLAAQAAQRAGAGLVTVAVPWPVWPVYATALQSIMVEPCLTAETPGPPEAAIGSNLGTWVDALADARRNVALLGPGLGQHVGLRQHVREALASPARAVVLDADALSLFAHDPDSLFRQCHAGCVLTPHEGEFVRLFGNIAGDKLARARHAAARSGAVVVLKGADTVVAAPDGRAVINVNAPPWLATAGTGDVLAGLVAGLLAQGVAPFAAAAQAVWLQGRAGQRRGRGLIADDLLAELPAVWAELAQG